MFPIDGYSNIYTGQRIISPGPYTKRAPVMTGRGKKKMQEKNMQALKALLSATKKTGKGKRKKQGGKGILSGIGSAIESLFGL
jgi:hypothetical protein